MVNYSVQPGELVDESQHPSASVTPVGDNPFPGLRPFTIEESHLFFGREGQVDEILAKLARFRSVTIMGYSGSGKSSLVNCGLVPVLYGGFSTETGPNWRVITTRPGSSPLSNMTDAIVNQMIAMGKVNAEDRQIQTAIIKSVLRGSSDGLVEVARYLHESMGENIFFLIDQFEEVLRFRDTGGDAVDESSLYANLILTAVHQKEVPVYVSLSLRSDFIGDCSVFPGLTQMINESNYLVPQMGREQKKFAIEGPIAVGGGTISTRLVKRLLSDMGDNQDQLPIMQHALMRTWDYWVANREEGEPMDIRHYNAIGRMSQALSLHANEAYDELSPNQKEIAEILFKSVTEKNQDNQGLRRPAKVKTIASLSGVSEEEVVSVVDAFRRTGRSFLMPGGHVVLNGETPIELSHESLMRIWTRLSNWVEEEFESSQLYKRISDAAGLYQTGKAGLWRPPDLQLALNWQKKQRPTRQWAQRYDEAFERAIVFLDTSRITYEAELRNQEMLQKRMLRRARITSLVMGIAAVIAILFMIYGFTQAIEAETQRNIAIEREGQAQAAALEAQRERDNAREQTKIAQQQREIAIESNKRLEVALEEARKAKAEAELQYRKALRQEQIAIAAGEKEKEARIIAIQQADSARIARDRADSLLYLSVAQSMEQKSFNMDEAELAGLLAMQGYRFHTQYGGKKYDTYVFRGLYYAVAKLTHNFNYNQAKLPGKELKNKMFGLTVSRKSSTFYTTGNDGRIFRGDYEKLSIDHMVDLNPYPNRVLALSPDEKFLVNGSDSSAIQIYHLDEPGSKPGIVRGHRGFVSDIRFLPDRVSFVSVGADRTVRLTNAATGQGKVLVTMPHELKSIDVSADGKWLAGVSAGGQLYMVNLEDNTFELKVNESVDSVRLLSVAFHPKKPILAYGTDFRDRKDNHRWKGSVKVIDYTTMEVLKELRGHHAGVSDIEFSPDGLLLASAGYDKKLLMWEVDHEEDLPVEMDNNNGNIWKISFAHGSDYLLASSNNGEVRVYPTNPKVLADQICPKLTRNMTKAEWGTYVANGIGYESTCRNLLISDF